MIGNKLHNLNKELTVSQRKTLIHQCSISSDKRMGILKNYLQNSPKSIDELNQFLIDTVNTNWPNSEQKEKDLKVRRLSSFFVEQIEKLIQCAVFAPNHKNTQPWHFHVFLDESMNRLREILPTLFPGSETSKINRMKIRLNQTSSAIIVTYAPTEKVDEFVNPQVTTPVG